MTSPSFQKISKNTLYHVDEILTKLGDAGFTLKLKKCSFFCDSVDYLGNIIKPGRLEIYQSHTKSLRDARSETNRSSIRSFLSLSNVYRPFIESFTVIAHPLNEVLRKGTLKTFEVDEEQLSSFSTFNEKICSLHFLAQTCSTLPYSVDTDDSAYGISFTVFQTPEDGTLKPIDPGSSH